MTRMMPFGAQSCPNAENLRCSNEHDSTLLRIGVQHVRPFESLRSLHFNFAGINEFHPTKDGSRPLADNQLTKPPRCQRSFQFLEGL